MSEREEITPPATPQPPLGGSVATPGDMRAEASGATMGPGVVATKTQAKGAMSGIAVGLVVGLLLGVIVGLLIGGGATLVICLVIGAVAGTVVGAVAGGATRPMRELDSTETSDH